jgi:hypothetical protein
MKYAEPRFTRDLDVWVNASSENASRVFATLAEFGAPLDSDGITPETFAQAGVVYQIGVAPVRIDILTRISGVEFPEAWRNRVPGTIFGVPVYFLSRKDLIVNKRAIGRPSDLEQLDEMTKASGDKL